MEYQRVGESCPENTKGNMTRGYHNLPAIPPGHSLEGFFAPEVDISCLIIADDEEFKNEALGHVGSYTNIVLVGHSLGGHTAYKIAQLLLSERPENAVSVLLVTLDPTSMSWGGRTTIAPSRWHNIYINRFSVFGKCQKVWGNQAARGSASTDLSPVFSPGYHCSNFPRKVPSRARARGCSMRCAPPFDHCIC